MEWVRLTNAFHKRKSTDSASNVFEKSKRKRTISIRYAHDDIPAHPHFLQSALGSVLDAKVEYVREATKGLVLLARQARKDGIWKLGLESSTHR